MHSWRVLLLPYLDHQALYGRYDFNEPWNGPHNSLLLKERPPVYGLHGIENRSESVSNYLAVVGTDTLWPATGGMSLDLVSDGPANTVSVVENIGSGIQWTEPRDLQLATMEMTLSGHPSNGISSWMDPPAAVTADGRLLSLPIDMTPHELRALLIRNDKPEPSELSTRRATEISDGRNRRIRNGAPLSEQ